MARGVALDLLHDLVRGERRVARDEQVYVVGANRQLQDFEVEFVGFLLDEFFETITYLVFKHRFAVLSGAKLREVRRSGSCETSDTR